MNKRIVKDSLCPIYKTEEETLEHLFLLCPWTAPVWFGRQICPGSTVLNTTHLCDWLDYFLASTIISVSDKEDYVSKAITTLVYLESSQS